MDVKAFKGLMICQDTIESNFVKLNANMTSLIAAIPKVFKKDKVPLVFARAMGHTLHNKTLFLSLSASTVQGTRCTLKVSAQRM